MIEILVKGVKYSKLTIKALEHVTEAVLVFLLLTVDIFHTFF